MKKTLPVGPKAGYGECLAAAWEVQPSQVKSVEVPLLRVTEDSALARVQSPKKPKGHQAWRVELWTLGAVVSQVLRIVNNNHPAPRAPENHHQKAEPEGIFTEFSEPTGVFDSFWEAHQPVSD